MNFALLKYQNPLHPFIVYTSTTPELIECVNEEIRKNLGDAPEILNYQDPSILAEVREHGYVTAGAAARLVGM